MKIPGGNAFRVGRRLTLTLALLIALILAGNGLVILQFVKARIQTDRLTGVSQQLIAVLRLQESLLSFHHQLNELAYSKDAQRLITEVQPLRTTLLEQAKETRRTLDYLPAEFRVDPAFLTALNTIEITLPLQLQDISALAAVGDWDVIRIHVDDELKRIEATTSAHVNSIDRDLDEELPAAVANMRDVRRRILVVVPATAISTVLIAVFFGWSVARRIMELRLEERVNERTRLARDLHDTLLQSFHGLMLRFQVVSKLLPEGKAKEQLEKTLERADQAIAEGRSAVYDLRSSATTTNDLSEALNAVGNELSAEDAAEFGLVVEGPPRDLHPIIRDELYRISREALRNSFRHARARHIEAEISYGERAFRLRIRDDGQGIPAEILEKGREGHYGLPGIRERARQIGAKLTIWSRAGSGTEIELSLGGSIAYVTSARRARFRLFGKKVDDT
jgi:signal transduction histidine kinase